MTNWVKRSWRSIRLGKWNYSGGGYLILQRVVEVVANRDKKADEKGEAFPEIIQRMIFAPLGMKSSSYAVPQDRPIAPGHDPQGKPLPGNFHVYPEQGAAGFWTTPSDLAQF